jgi:hypothetical protein
VEQAGERPARGTGGRRAGDAGAGEGEVLTQP